MLALAFSGGLWKNSVSVFGLKVFRFKFRCLFFLHSYPKLLSFLSKIQSFLLGEKDSKFKDPKGELHLRQ